MARPVVLLHVAVEASAATAATEKEEIKHNGGRRRTKI
jgi:hypothetical protein